MENTRRTFLAQSAMAAGMLHAQTSKPSKPDIFQLAAAGDVPGVTKLIEADPTVARARAADGRTPLHFATAAGQAEMTIFLISKGAEINTGPEAPLLAAIDCADKDAAWNMSFSMLGNAADPNARRGDKTALELARARGYTQIEEMLIHRQRVHFDRRYIQGLDRKPVKRDDTNGLPWTQINPFVSLSHFNFQRVKELLKETPALLNTRASWDELPVEAAAHTGQFEMCMFLAEQGAAVSTCTAVLLGQTEMVKDAIAADPLCVQERGAHDIAILAYTGWAKEQTEIAEMLLKAGAPVDARSFHHTTLHLAAQKGYVELANLLVKHGADVNAIAMTGASGKTAVTPLAIAVAKKQEKMEQFLRDHGAKN